MDTFPVRLDGLDIEFQCKRLKLREFKKILTVLEAIKTSGMSSKTVELIEEGLQLLIATPENVCDLVEIDQALNLISEAVKGGRVSDNERKKSE